MIYETCQERGRVTMDRHPRHAVSSPRRFLAAPRNHFWVWIVKPSGCHCRDALGGNNIVECRPILGALPLSLRRVIHYGAISGCHATTFELSIYLSIYLSIHVNTYIYIYIYTYNTMLYYIILFIIYHTILTSPFSELSKATRPSDSHPGGSTPRGVAVA